MIVTFGEQPPVYAKSRSEMQQSSTPYPVQCKYALLARNHKLLLFYFNLISYNVSFLQRSCLYLVVEMYRIPVSRRIHRVLNTPAAATYIHRIRLQHPEDSHIRVLTVLMLETLPATRHKATMVHIRRIRQPHSRYHNCDHLS